MIYHVLNGDALIERFMSTGIDGQVIVARECLVEGGLAGDTIENFYKTRAAFIKSRYEDTEDNYYRKVVAEFDTLLQAPGSSEFNLWFGYDLFCQVNLWFIISLLNDPKKRHSIDLIYPSYLSDENVWDDFGNATSADLIGCYERRIRVDTAGIVLGTDLWTAYKNADFARLDELSKIDSPYYPYLKEVCQAHIQRFPTDDEEGRPEKAIERLITEGLSDFNTVFHKFSQREGVYGFSDLQVKQIFETVKDRREDL